LARAIGTSSSDYEQRDGRPHRHGLPSRGKDCRHDAVVGGLNAQHIGLVRLNDDDGVSLVDAVALGGGLGDDQALRHGGAKR